MDFDSETKTLTINIENQHFPAFTETEILPNFFIAKTEIIRTRNRWDDDLKLQEHTAFFYSAKRNNLKIGFSNVFSIQHKPIKPRKYYSFRGRNYSNIFMEKAEIERIIMTFEDKADVIIEHDNR